MWQQDLGAVVRILPPCFAFLLKLKFLVTVGVAPSDQPLLDREISVRTWIQSSSDTKLDERGPAVARVSLHTLMRYDVIAPKAHAKKMSHPQRRKLATRLGFFGKGHFWGKQLHA
eukprot:jgi/Botrbrau1/4990/Bobra.0396s0016.1